MQRTRTGTLRDTNRVGRSWGRSITSVLTSGFSFTFSYTKTYPFLYSLFLSDVPIHTSFNNLSPKHTQTYPQPSDGVSSQEREFAREGWRGMLMKSGTGPRNVIRPPHLQERRNRPPNFTMMMSACLHDSVWLRCQVSPLSLCFVFFIFPSLALFHCLFCSLCFFLFYQIPLLLFFFVIFLSVHREV